MKKYYLFLFILILTGCGKTTTVLNHFGNNEKAAYAIQHTKKVDLIEANKVKAMLFATYLNKVDKKYTSKKFNSFIIGFHRVNKNQHELFENNYKLTLNGKEADFIQEINKNDNDLLKYISLKNPWAKYYLIKFKNDENNKLILNLSQGQLDLISLKFEKKKIFVGTLK